MWGIIYDERIMGYDEEFGDHWEVVDVDEYNQVGEPDDIQSVIDELLKDDIIEKKDVDSFNYSDIVDFVYYLNKFLNGDSWCESYQVVYFCYKEIIDKNFFTSKKACERYIAINKYNYDGDNIRPFKVIARA